MSPFFGSLMMIPSFHWASTSFSQILLKTLYSMLTAVSMSALMTSDGISSGLAAFPLLRVMMAFLISAFEFEGLSQLMGYSVSADGMSGGESGVGQFSSSLKHSDHRFSCSWLLTVGSILVLHWLACLPEFACQLLGHQVQVPLTPLSSCCLCLSS